MTCTRCNHSIESHTGPQDDCEAFACFCPWFTEEPEES